MNGRKKKGKERKSLSCLSEEGSRKTEGKEPQPSSTPQKEEWRGVTGGTTEERTHRQTPEEGKRKKFLRTSN